MIEYKVKFPNTALFNKKNVPTVLRLTVKKLEEAGALVAQRAVDEAPFGASGYLKSSIRPINIFNPMGVRVHPMADYAPGVELGTAPHYVPFKDLRYWAKRKFSVDIKRAAAIARVVQRNIQTRGTKGQHFMQAAFEGTKGKVDRIFDSLGKELIRELGRP